MGHRRFLPKDHVYRKKKNEFNGCTEHETARKRYNAYDQVKNINTVLGKITRDGNGAGIWKKKSIFWDLPYWKDLEVRHCLDVMNIEKNVCDSLLGLLLNIPVKTKDGIRVRRDMQEMGIRKELAPVEKGNREIKSCGPVFLRYMYPFERYMGFLKDYVRNRNRPEGSIVEGYASEKAIEFCTGYLEGVKSIGVPQSLHMGKLEGVGGVGMETFFPTYDCLQLAHLVVLKHMTCIEPFVEEHMNVLRSTYRDKDEMWHAQRHNKEFSSWLKTKVTTLTNVDQTVKRLAHGPHVKVTSYQGYKINSYTFYTKDQDEKSTVQNSGVTVIASTTELDRTNHDRLLRIAKNSYYGVIEEIWELNYYSFTIPLFKCKWVNNHTGVHVDKYGFTLVDLTSEGYASKPFILAKLVTQVFFVNDPSRKRYHIVLQGKRRILGVDDVVNEEEYDQFDDLPPFSVGVQSTVDTTNGETYFRSDHNDGIYVDKARKSKNTDKQ
ncbi:uncharacterized protein LOC143555453 [Bidens hawaiensis]|uniref:uncharacterized protein LOC143555453 n=1 Tax=Bidens hawaiensis TaxID=980011 RepID=UPI00404B6844